MVAGSGPDGGRPGLNGGGLALGISALMVRSAVRAARLEYRLDERGLTIAWGRGFTIPVGRRCGLCGPVPAMASSGGV